MELPYTKSVSEILEYYNVSESEGLSEERVQEQRKQFGYNGEEWLAVSLYVFMRCG